MSWNKVQDQDNNVYSVKLSEKTDRMKYYDTIIDEQDSYLDKMLPRVKELGKKASEIGMTIDDSNIAIDNLKYSTQHNVDRITNVTDKTIKFTNND